MPDFTTPEYHVAGAGVPSEWAGDDQRWWDWYMTLAADPGAEPAQSAPVAPAPLVAAASDREVEEALGAPYLLSEEALAFFRRHGFVRLPGVLAPAVVAALAQRADRLLETAYGPDNPGRFLALEQLWLTDPLMRAVALSRRLGDIAAQLIEVDAVRLYHDNILSKEPGCGRTPWHRDSDHYPLDSPAIVTSWMPLRDIPTESGPLGCLSRQDASRALSGLSASPLRRAFDEQVTARLRQAGARPFAEPLSAGEVSFHAADCFHTAGANRTTAPRRVLSTTYYADGTRIIPEPTPLSGAWTDFVPGIRPGDVAASALNPVVGAYPTT
ncbi:phytanoyl-CoA dioxygenase family protein [Streptomyces sp. NRRL B-24572]|uniref:phytanoyl-CoA dioxygenase family protein n=1 Tax=Streptomyces sp. NRRL B-24572 TaxID=1962156 RepID=UPI000A3B7187|nr:phytanoyl-CoA dioxygenase family protein [Streptomyces sp. NRRL B-24572]